MNRREFIKTTASTTAFLGSAAYAIPLRNPTTKPSTLVESRRYILELRVREFKEGEKLFADEDFDRWSDEECSYTEDFWINGLNTYESIEDAVSQIFQHCEHFDYKKCEVRYDILYGDEKHGIGHAGYYYFFDSNYKPKNEEGKTYLYQGWHTSNPLCHQEYYKQK